jgi:hypothetical protein
LFVGREAQQGANDAAEALQLHAVARPHEGAERLLQVLLLGAAERGKRGMTAAEGRGKRDT